MGDVTESPKRGYSRLKFPRRVHTNGRNTPVMWAKNRRCIREIASGSREKTAGQTQLLKADPSGRIKSSS